MPEAVINGVLLYYEDEGSGYPFILLHGLGQNVVSLRNEIEVFKKDYRVIALDSRGHGKSEKPTYYKLQDHVEDVLKLMDYLKIERANLMGGSMGSYIAQGVAIAAPERVNKLVLVSPKPNGKTSSMARLFTEHADELVGLSTLEKIKHLSKYIFHDLSKVDAWVQKTNTEGTLLNEEEQAAANVALEGFDFRPELHNITARTLVISGKFDGLNPPAQGMEIQELIPQADFIKFEHSGHAPNVEEPDLFIEKVSRFLKE